MKNKARKTLKIQIDSLSNSGDGVGRLDNKVIFVPLALPGEKVSIEIVQDKKTFAKAKLVEIHEASPDRIAPQCEVFGKCGGCDWQNLSYEKQLFWKQKNLEEVLSRIGQIKDLSLVKEIHPSPQPFFYRNRIQIHWDRKGWSFFAKGSRQKVYISHCPIASQPINAYLKEFSNNSLPAQKIEIAEMADGNIETFSVDELGQSEMGFRQVNSTQNFFINSQIQDLVRQERITKVIDLYCGQGNWSIELAKGLRQIQCMGIDSSPTNIQKAAENSPPNCQFLLGDALELLKKNKDWRELIIIDPPRAGCSPEVLEALCLDPSHWLVYISCHPATMARDLNQLTSAGWTIHQILPIDMFPQTSHLECFTILRSANSLKTANP